jgi:CheY-like chemotaxis protein
MARILAGVISGTDARLRHVLEGHEVRIVRTMAEAIAALSDWQPDLVVIGMRFDQSRMFDLVRYIRSQPRYCATPVVCLRVNAKALGVLALDSVKLAAKELGAQLFLDFQEFPDDARGNAEMRGAIDSFVKSSSRDTAGSS